MSKQQIRREEQLWAMWEWATDHAQCRFLRYVVQWKLHALYAGVSYGSRLRPRVEG